MSDNGGPGHTPTSSGSLGCFDDDHTYRAASSSYFNIEQEEQGTIEEAINVIENDPEMAIKIYNMPGKYLSLLGRLVKEAVEAEGEHIDDLAVQARIRNFKSIKTAPIKIINGSLNINGSDK